MKKLPFYIGLSMISIQAIIVGIYFVSQMTISDVSLSFWAMLFTAIPLNLAAFTMLIFGLVSD